MMSATGDERPADRRTGGAFGDGTTFNIFSTDRQLAALRQP
jgi:hypothetical protein